MHHFIFPTQDTWISSGSSKIDGTSFKDQNFGKDQILEVKKEFYNHSFDYPTRALLQFDGTDFTAMSQSIVEGKITNPKFYLKLYEAEGNAEMTEEYKLVVQPISQSWTEGTGKFGDRPKNTNGCSWENRSNPLGGNELTWSSFSASGSSYASASLGFAHNPTGSLGLGSATTATDGADVIKVGGVSFFFVSESKGMPHDSDSIFVEFGHGAVAAGLVGAKAKLAKNMRDAINGHIISGTIDLKVSASLPVGSGGSIILSGSVAGTVGNITITTGSTSTTPLFISASVNNNATFNMTGGTDSQVAVTKNGPSVLNVSSSIKSFSNQSPDVEVDVSDMVNMWLGAVRPNDHVVSNHGMVIRFSGSQETDSETFGHLKFFSRNTHTIYQPKLEVRWDDHLPCTGSNTGSLTQLTSSGLADNYLYMRGLREEYREGERVKFRVGARKRYIQKTFNTSVQTISGSFIPESSGSYAIKDVATDEYIVPFSSYTSMSCDENGNYFNQWLDGFYPDRVYKIQLKLKTDDGQEQIFDDDFEFIIKRS